MFERKRVDHFRHYRIAQPNAAQQGSALSVKQPAVVGRQPNRGIADVDGAAQVVERRPVTGGHPGEHIALVLAAPHVATDLVPHAVIVVTGIADRQQVAVLGVEDEQQAVEQDQSRFPDLLQGRVRRGLGDGMRQSREYFVEHKLGEACGHPLLIKPGLIDRSSVKGTSIGWVRQEGISAEREHEHLEPVAALFRVQNEQAVVVSRKIEHRRQADLEELLRDRKRALPVQTPVLPVGQNAPAHPAFAEVVHAAKIAEHLCGGRGFLAPFSGPAVQQTRPALGLHDRQPEFVPLPFLEEAVGVVFRGIVLEQQPIGDILAAACGKVLLAQARRPSECLQHRPDQVVLCLAFVRRCGGGKPDEQIPQPSVDLVKRRVGHCLPVGQRLDGTE